MEYSGCGEGIRKNDATKIAGSMGCPFASSAAIAEAKVHPVPCVLWVSTRDPESSCQSTPARVFPNRQSAMS